MEKTLVIAGYYRPARFTGGADRLAYIFLSELIKKRRYDLYFLSLTQSKLFPIPDRPTLERITIGSPPKSRLISTATNFVEKAPFLKEHAYNLYDLARQTVKVSRDALLQKQLVALSKSRRMILHLWFTAGAEWVASFRQSNNGIRIILSEQSKGSVLREWEQMHGEIVKKRLKYSLCAQTYSSLLRHADRVIFPSLGALQLFEESTNFKLDGGKIGIIYNGVEDLMPLVGDNTQEVEHLYLTVADHVPEKGLDLILEGLSKLQTDWRWEIIGGETEWTKHFRKQIKESGCENRVHILGRLPFNVVVERISKAHAIIMMQRVAVFDLALLEAMAAGKAILATPVGGNLEALGEDYPLYVRNPMDLPNLIARLSDPEFTAKIKHRNRKRYEENFTKERMLDRFVEEYEQLFSLA